MYFKCILLRISGTVFFIHWEKKKYVNVGCSHGLHNASVLRRCKIPAEALAWLPWSISTLQ